MPGIYNLKKVIGADIVMDDFVQKLLEFETVELRNFRILSKYEIWPIIRYAVLNKAVSEYLNLQRPHAEFERKSLSQKLSYLSLSLLKKPWVVSQEDILFFVSARSNTVKKEGKYFNVLTDYYALIFRDQTTVLEESFRLGYKYPRYFPTTYYIDFMFLQGILKSKIFKKSIDKDSFENINGFLEYLKVFFPMKLEDTFLNSLKELLMKYALRIPYWEHSYKELFEKFSPKIVFINTASYGGRNALLTCWAHDLGIKVGEFQHGVISRIHLAYNYGNGIINSAWYKKYLPDFLLLWGKYWREQIKTPSEKHIVGNAHIIEKRKQLEADDKKLDRNKKVVLMISQGTLTSTIVELTRKLSKLLGDNYTIMYKLHPGEVPFKERYKVLHELPNVLVVSEGDIYDYIFNSNYVVGVYSTTLYEAIAFRKPVFILKHPLSEAYIDPKIGKFFSDAEELVNLILETGDEGNKDILKTEYFWANEWKHNYREFVKSIL
ncbi:MAG: hypothetical protein PWQ27_413 [Kosmotoga sp.]|nr:hypothetical protein [Thermotogaceae bacterium]MDK2953030.1 hypothetical protein [Kosmotoga sp.]